MSSVAQLPVLVVDDQIDVRNALRLSLKAKGWGSLLAESPAQALELLGKHDVAIALVDLNYARDTTSGDEGIALIEQLSQRAPLLPIVAMTAWGNVELAVRAMRAGARDFIEKPWDNARLMTILQNQQALAQSQRRAAALSAEHVHRQSGLGASFIAESASMRSVLDMIERVAPTDANILILGENGTGKGIIATQIHARSARRLEPLLKVNMGAIAESVFESEFFGHVRGAFTDAKSDRIGRFEAADGGTLFLDEIANIPPSQQPKLLRVLESGEFERLGSSQTRHANTRLISATNADLAMEVNAGRFRKDLWFRLNTIEVHLPPLRERKEDLIPMARAFLTRAAARYGRITPKLSDSVEKQLLRYPWPGNVRELEHMMERIVLICPNPVIALEDLPFPTTRAASLAAADTSDPWTEIDDMRLDAMEDRMIERAMRRFDGNIHRVSEVLGLTRQALYRRLQKRPIGTIR